MLKQKIEDYRTSRLKNVEAYVTDLTAKAESLENAQSNFKRFYKESSTATIILERATREEEFLKVTQQDTTTAFDCDEQALIKSGGKANDNGS